METKYLQCRNKQPQCAQYEFINLWLKFSWSCHHRKGKCVALSISWHHCIKVCPALKLLFTVLLVLAPIPVCDTFKWLLWEYNWPHVVDACIYVSLILTLEYFVSKLVCGTNNSEIVAGCLTEVGTGPRENFLSISITLSTLKTKFVCNTVIFWRWWIVH